jgi:hypothetical protein
MDLSFDVQECGMSWVNGVYLERGVRAGQDLAGVRWQILGA